ncbi:MAG: hypothetical protein EXR78_02455 [Deltaproteobacteria bacterium]|nr:hypothetical protein [Deltaproteobacteria bacterium]
MLYLSKITTGIAAGALLAVLGSGCAAKQTPNDTWTASAQSASASASRSEEAARRAEAAAARVEAAAQRAEDAAARVGRRTTDGMNK